MVDGGFRESFHIIDFLNNQTLPREDYELVWIEYYGDVKDELKSKEGVRIFTLGNLPDVEYHSSCCFNEGIRKSKGDVLVILDADIMIAPTFLETICKEHDLCESLVMYFYRCDEPEDTHDKSQSYTLDYLKRVSTMTNPSNYGGCLTARKKWLLEINGYEEDRLFASGFHANGLDVYTRLKNLGLHIRWHPTERIYHPWHPSTLLSSEGYKRQHSIIRKRQYNLTTLPNYGLDPEKNKKAKELPEENKEMSIKRFFLRLRKILPV